MAKLKNLKPGVQVIVKDKPDSDAYSEHLGKHGTVFAVEPPDYTGDLWVGVVIDEDPNNITETDDRMDWMHYNDVRLESKA